MKPESVKPSVLLLGGEHRNALGVVRDLGRLGIPVYVGADRRFARSNYSRYVTRRFVYPSAEREPEAAHKAVLAKIREWRPDVLLPAMDADWHLVYSHYDSYCRLLRVVPCPGRDLFERMLNKKTMTEQAQRCGMPTP